MRKNISRLLNRAPVPQILRAGGRMPVLWDPNVADSIPRGDRRKWIFAIAIPIIIQNIVQHLQMVIDRAFLGNLDPRYLSAIGNVMTPFNAVTLFLFSASMGLTILVAQNIGAGRPDRARDFAESSYVYATAFSGLLFLVWYLGASQIFSLLGARGQVLADSTAYVRILAISLFFIGAEITSGAVLQGAGYTRPIMITGITKNLLNILFDYLLIFGNWGFPQLGLQGAAVATVIANAVGAILLTTLALTTRRLPFRYKLAALLRPKWRHYYGAVRIGLPAGFESLLWFSGQLAVVRMVNSLDELAIGIVSLVQGIYLMGLFVYLGFARAATTIVGQLWGKAVAAANASEDGSIAGAAAAPDLLPEQPRPPAGIGEALRAGFHCQKYGFLISLGAAALMLSIPQTLAGIFTRDPEVIRRAAVMIRLAALFVPAQSINIVMGHAIRGTGDTKWMLYSQIFGTIMVVGFSYVMIFPAGFGLAGVYITLIIDEWVRGIINMLRFRMGQNPFRRDTGAVK
ncbi:MATE family efflux transporter [Spirochaeta africana]|uniref:Multidrug-efflux transporter n=1 Tax=Spirochaeta africana (strain ATCC 700263 / DSM 8902 / Z-7692) TaxID=889378 RepID=H9UM68_SPIAZ|nr:MATE family efflux transporter [Spirochaeta africana]AFG38611.1 putative efflux protein, MATE family [Spirochaeta africana DSM 8902]